MEISFTNSIYLWLLFSLPILIFAHSITFNRYKSRALKFANFEAISRITGEQFIAKNVFLLVFRLAILVFIVFAISGTTLTYIGVSTDANYVLAIDSSASMLAQDLQPNRLVAAKQTLNAFLDFIPRDTKVGLVSFSGVTLIENSITDDNSMIKRKINNLEVSETGGTDIGNAIAISTNMLVSERDDRSKIVILITDGQSNTGLDLEQAIIYANKNNVIVNTIGMGTEEGGRFIGTDILSKVDTSSLENIAKKTSGNFYKAETEEPLTDIFRQIAKLNRKKVSIELSFYLIISALILLLTEWALINTKNKIIS